MLAAVVGGNLQGVEATYLAQKAGWEVLLIDKTADVPASGLCDSFIQLDVTRRNRLGRAIKEVDLVIPALENNQAIETLVRGTSDADIPIAFNHGAYQISSSKIRSDRLFARIGVSAPKPWPQCSFPVVAKPSNASGSKGVKIFSTKEEMQNFYSPNFPPEAWVLQEFIQGPSYSLEVLGVAGNYIPLQVTDLDMDAAYDCKRVTAPTGLSPEFISTFKKKAVHIARALNLKGLMDLEVILNEGELKVLEIDARLPSQTPTVVFWSTGLNIVQMLGELFMSPDWPIPEIAECRGVVYEHIRVSPGLIETAGEHIMSGAGPLHVRPDFFGTDEAITNYTPGRNRWVATLIFSALDLKEAWAKRNSVIKTIRKQFGLNRVCDLNPDKPEIWNTREASRIDNCEILNKSEIVISKYLEQ